jgi:hypothetical protein
MRARGRWTRYRVRWGCFTVTLENFNLSHLPIYIMGEDQLSRYALYMATLGNRSDLFPSSAYVGKYVTNGPTLHEVPEAYLADETFAAIVAEQKENNPALFLEAAIPYRNRLTAKDADFQRLLKVCNGIKVVCDKYGPNCFFARKRYMVAESSRVIAVYDGRVRGGTLFTMRAAHTQGEEVRVIEV